MAVRDENIPYVNLDYSNNSPHLTPNNITSGAQRRHHSGMRSGWWHTGDVARESPWSVLLGLLLLVSGSVLLICNEGDAVRTSRSVEEGSSQVRPLSTATVLFPENEGKLVHLSGPLATEPPLEDLLYNIEINAVRLKRRVQMLQWTEAEEEESVGVEGASSSSGGLQGGGGGKGGSVGTSYSYSTAWKGRVVDSSSFNVPAGHENPQSLPLEGMVENASVVQIGAFYLSAPILAAAFSVYTPFSGDSEPETGDVKLHAGMYYSTRDIFSPAVGDMRVQFYYAGHSGDTYSLVGIQHGSTILPYTSSSGQELVLLQPGQLSADEVFATHRAQSRLYNWGMRIVGFCVLCVAVAVMNDFVHCLVSQSSLLRDVSAMSNGHFIVTVAMSASLAVIAGSWCVYRPVLAACLLLLALLPILKAGYYSGTTTTTRAAATRGPHRFRNA